MGTDLRRRPPLDLDDVIYGVHAVEEALGAGERVRRLHIAADRQRDPAVRNILQRAADLGVRARFEGRGFFNQFPYKAHQGVIAIGQPFEYVSVEDLLGSKRNGPRLFVALDHITDPHNAGAIIRTAECAGADGIILPERRAAGVNATVRKVSAGATSYLPIARAGNLAEALRTLKKAGVWVAGADIGAEAVDFREADLARDLAIVIGAEGKGISSPVRRECDYLLRIPLLGQVASLNASVAAAILLYEAVRQRR